VVNDYGRSYRIRTGQTYRIHHTFKGIYLKLRDMDEPYSSIQNTWYNQVFVRKATDRINCGVFWCIFDTKNYLVFAVPKIPGALVVTKVTKQRLHPFIKNCTIETNSENIKVLENLTKKWLYINKENLHLDGLQFYYIPKPYDFNVIKELRQ